MDVERISAPGFEGYVKSEQGGRRENQDYYGWCSTDMGLVVTVCDGMGGGPAGRTASTIAVDKILDFLKNTEQKEASEEIVLEAIRRANLAVYQKACSAHELQGMGSTCTVLLLAENKAFAAYVGDSRIYQLRGHKKVYRTFDHSMVFELVKQKVITEEQARQSAQSNIITRALGLKDNVEIDITTLHYKKGDRFFLSSDGIHGAMPERELLDEVTNTEVPMRTIVEQLANRVDEIGMKKGGGHDNMTLVLLESEKTNNGGFWGWLKNLFS
ncbi:MAG: serine/threonine-protein phosphatase [Prevotella sp.]|nr:serine/threonine-protein phosphatase [Prevotella sp.]